ncbi:hypothetical protein PSPO01_00436 [Paraphaeosphaeria sporulosa]
MLDVTRAEITACAFPQTSFEMSCTPKPSPTWHNKLSHIRHRLNRHRPEVVYVGHLYRKVRWCEGSNFTIFYAHNRRVRPCPKVYYIRWRLRGKFFWKVNQPPCNSTKIGQVGTKYPACNRVQKRTSWQTCKMSLDLEQSSGAQSFAICRWIILLPVAMPSAVPWYLLPGSATRLDLEFGSEAVSHWNGSGLFPRQKTSA